jgi:hypothetical protein
VVVGLAVVAMMRALMGVDAFHGGKLRTKSPEILENGTIHTELLPNAHADRCDAAGQRRERVCSGARADRPVRWSRVTAYGGAIDKGASTGGDLDRGAESEEQG